MSMDNSKVLSFASATGKIEYNMTNNYMFRYILQEKDEEIERLHALLAEHGIAK